MMVKLTTTMTLLTMKPTTMLWGDDDVVEDFDDDQISYGDDACDHVSLMKFDPEGVTGGLRGLLVRVMEISYTVVNYIYLYI
jgi:hypothetical protein